MAFYGEGLAAYTGGTVIESTIKQVGAMSVTPQALRKPELIYLHKGRTVLTDIYLYHLTRTQQVIVCIDSNYTVSCWGMLGSEAIYDIHVKRSTEASLIHGGMSNIGYQYIGDYISRSLIIPRVTWNLISK